MDSHRRRFEIWRIKSLRRQIRASTLCMQVAPYGYGYGFKLGLQLHRSAGQKRRPVPKSITPLPRSLLSLASDVPQLFGSASRSEVVLRLP